MKKLDSLNIIIKNIFNDLEKVDIKEFKTLKYPKLISFIKMKVEKYKVPNYGYIMIMNTSCMGMMKLLTISFTPSTGINVPFLLIDTMSLSKKRLAYFELYDTTNKNNDFSTLRFLKDDYSNIEDYQEKQAWYVEKRMLGSLIKISNKKDEEKLVNMLEDALKRYKDVIDNEIQDLTNIERLKEFSSQMKTLGNPSSKTLNMVLGKEKAQQFFDEIVMPIE